MQSVKLILKLMFLSMFFFNMLFVFSFHPLGMIFTLVIQTILLSLMLFLVSHFPWYSYTLILVFLGGMLVLFTYMANIASNEKFTPKISFLYSLPLFLAMLILLPKMNTLAGDDSAPVLEEFSTGFSAMKIYESVFLYLISIMAALIVLTLLAVVKVSKVDMGPIRID